VRQPKVEDFSLPSSKGSWGFRDLMTPGILLNAIKLGLAADTRGTTDLEEISSATNHIFTGLFTVEWVSMM